MQSAFRNSLWWGLGLLFLLTLPARAQTSGEIAVGGQSMKIRFAFATFRSPGYLYVLMLPYQPDADRVKNAREGASLVEQGKPYAEFNIWFKQDRPDPKAIQYANMAIYGLSAADAGAGVDYSWKDAAIASHFPTLQVSTTRLTLASASTSASKPVRAGQPSARWNLKLSIPVKELR